MIWMEAPKCIRTFEFLGKKSGEISSIMLLQEGRSEIPITGCKIFIRRKNVIGGSAGRGNS